MRLINAKQLRSTPFLVTALVLYLSISTSSAEWIQAKIIGSNNDIWVNTETNALYVGENCSPLMKLKHLSGTKPRSLQQRQQAYLNQLSHNSSTRQDPLNTTNRDDLTDSNTTSPIALDPLNLSYLTQPEFDPLNRNKFNLSIDNNNIILASQHARINARISGRYDRRSLCGF